MADHFQIGVKRGDLLVATPKVTHMPWKRAVIFVTESSSSSVMGTIMNRPTMMSTSDATDSVVPRRQIYMGGPIQTHAMFMLHTLDFTSTNTLLVNSTWGVSSDQLMFDKLAEGQEPTWYRFYMGAAGWNPRQLYEEIESGAWMLLKNPTFESMTGSATTQWQTCVDQISSAMFSDYL